MKRLPCAILVLSCIGVAAGTPAFSGESAMPGQLGMRVGGFPGPGGHGGPRHQDLALSETQQQQAFAIGHAEEPLRFEQGAALRRAHAALRAMSDAGQFDEAKATALSQAIGKAEAALALSQARSAARFIALLTPEQRARLQDDGAPTARP
ncbi:MAG TPA: periplasmic heavy metal sensor [Telluria sp.]